MSFQDYLDLVAKKLQQPDQKKGQVYFNVLSLNRPDLMSELRDDTGLNTYHNDENIPTFLEWLRDVW